MTLNDLERAVKDLRSGKIILLHDSYKRENEVDMVMAAQFVKPQDIAKMRKDAGGLICVAIHHNLWHKLGLPFMDDLLGFSKEKFPVLNHLRADDISYDRRSSFSITVNHRRTFTGITDKDRALTIRKLAEFFSLEEISREKFGEEFRSPGHVPLLLATSLKNRQGHTELSTTLLEISGLIPVAVICEMLDSETYEALKWRDAAKYARENNTVLISGDDILRKLKLMNR